MAIKLDPRGFWSHTGPMNFGALSFDINLITPAQLAELEPGTELYSIMGECVVVGKDRIDDDTRFGFLAYGVRV